MLLLRRLPLATLLVTISTFYSVGQTLIVNEVSNGPSGNQEYVEFVVVDNAVSYDCNSSTPPCIDIRGWIFDDNSGYHNAVGVATGAIRFSQDPLWSCVPLGTIILIYNNADPNTSIGVDDISLADGNCTIVAPIGDPNLFETNATTPGAVACSYPVSGWTPGGNWNNTLFANGGDCARIVDLGGCEVFSVCWGTANANNLIYFAGSGQDDVWYFNDGDPNSQINWLQGCAGDIAACGGNLQTPGAPNNSANAAFIGQFNNGCTPITPIEVTANSIDAGCGCDGSASASASGSIAGYTFIWYDATYTPIGQTGPNAINLCEGTYHVIGESSIGCTDTATVVINSSIVLSVSVNSETICTGQSTTLNATPSIIGGTFLWNPDGQTTPSINVSPGSTTIYSVSYSLSGCDANANGTITVNPIPIVNAGIDQTLCAGSTVTLSGSGAISYSWDNGITNGASFTPVSTTTYTVTGTDSNTCVNTDQVIVTVNPLPIVNAGIDQTVCAGTAVTFSGSGATSYSWDNGVTDGISFTPTSTTTYTVIGTDANGCQNTDQILVTVNPMPQFTTTGTNPSSCGSSDGFITLSGLTASTNYFLSYEDDGVTVGPITITTDASGIFIISGLNAGNYTNINITSATSCSSFGNNINLSDPVAPTLTIVASYDPTTCSGNDGLIRLNIAPGGNYNLTYQDDGVTVGPLAISTDFVNDYVIIGLNAGNYTNFSVENAGCSTSNTTIITLADPLPPPVDAGMDQTICAGSTVSLTGSGASTLAWDNGVTDGVTFTPTSTLTYTLTGTDVNGCVNTDQVIVTVNPLPNVNAGLDQTACEGSAVVLSGSGATNLVWDNGVTDGVVFAATATTTYTVSGTDANGCMNSDQVLVTVNPLPIVYAGADQTLCAGTNLTIYGTGAMSYSWDNSVTDGISFNPLSTATYTVSGIDVNGCENTDQVVITVNPLPTIDAGADQIICEGTVVTLTGNGAVSYSWDNGVTDGIAFTPLITTTYTLTGSGTNGCTNTDQIVVSVNPLPTVNAGNDQTICDGTNVTLSSSGASSYAWDNGVTNGVIFVPAIGSVTYTVTGTDANNCVNTDQVVVTVNPNPVPSISGPIEYCIGTFATLNTTSPYTSYLWSSGANTPATDVTATDNPITVTVTNSFGCAGTSAAFTVTENSVISYNLSITICEGQTALIHGNSETVAGVYSQTYVLPSGCDSTSNVTLTVNPLPTINAGTDQAICIGDPVTLEATGASTYTWDNSVENGITFSPAATAIYSVTGTDDNGCVNTDQIIVTVNTIPVVDAGPDLEVCEGTTLLLSASGALNYSWDNGVTDGVLFLQSIGTTTYSVTGTDANGCQDTDQIIAIVNPLPNVNAGSDQTLCEGTTVTLYASGANSYSWDNGIIDGTPFVQNMGHMTYTVTGTDINGCVNSDIVDVVVNPLPIVNAGNDLIICEGTDVTLVGSGALSYSWDNGIIDNSAFTPSFGTTTYTVTGTDNHGCSDTDQVEVIVNLMPIVNAGNDTIICQGNLITLNGSGASTYEWTNNVESGIPFTPSVGTLSYILTGTDTNGCEAQDQLTITVNPIPEVEAGPDLSFCDGETVVLTGSGAINYSWDNGVTDGAPFIPSSNGTYKVTGTDANGCTDVDQMNISIKPIPVPSFIPDITNGCAPLSVNYTNTTIDAVDCIWTFGNNDVSTNCDEVTTTFINPGCYDVTLTTIVNGCSGSTTIPDLICVEANPVASFNQSNSVLSTINTVVEFENTSTGASTYQWDFGDNTPSVNEVNPSHTYTDESESSYNVMLIAISDFGCKDTAYSAIRVEEELIYYIPNTFTPDGDEFNQTFKPVFTSGYDPFDYSLLIFNRWGEIIFESHDTEFGWDGTYGADGNIIQDGVYIWKIEFKVRNNDERIIHSGHVNKLK